MLRTILFAWLGFATLAFAADAADDQPTVTRQQHRWGRFEPGAWSLARIVIENLEGDAVVSTSSTEQRTTLLEVDEQSVLLRIEARIEVDGKRFDAPTQTVRQLFTGDNISPASTYEIEPAGSGTVTIEGQAHTCQVLNITMVDPSGTTSVKCYYNSMIEPYLLRAEAKTTTDETVSQQSTGEILALDMPYHLRDQITSTTMVQEIVSKAKSTERTLIRRSFVVPGATVSRSSKELDSDGRLIRRSTFELVDYGTHP